MYHIAAFDFDGTLTRKDSFLEFIKFAKGKKAFWIGLVLHAPILIALKLHLYPNWKAKQRLFFYFFKGMKHCEFQALGQKFAPIIETFVCKGTLQKLRNHRFQGDCIYVISASIEEWVRPWCENQGVDCVIGTQIETNSSGIITGRFLSKNCYGPEKVRRLLEKEPNRQAYHLTAYGDSKGDFDLLNFADQKEWIK